MSDRVSADTILKITTDSEFSDGETPTPPTIKKLISKIHKSLELRIQEAEDFKDKNDVKKVGLSPLFNDKAGRAYASKKDFDRILNNIPRGFKLAPVLYVVPKKKEKRNISTEFSRKIRRPFLQYVAKHHEQELLDMGISPHGIKNLKAGVDPANENGQLYNTNIDHIIERGGAGLWAHKKSPDLDNNGQLSYPVNHFKNLMFIPEHVHNFKNRLNSLQLNGNLEPGEKRWILMLVPKRDEKFSGFVSPAQDKGHILHGIDMRKANIGNGLGHINSMIKKTCKSIRNLNKNITLGRTLSYMQYDAHKNGKTVAQIAHEESKLDRKFGLRYEFNAVIANNDSTKNKLEHVIHPGIKSINAQLKDLFNSVPKNPTTKRDISKQHKFQEFYNGKNINMLRRAISKLPIAEAWELQETLEKIDKDIKKAAIPKPPQNKL